MKKWEPQELFQLIRFEPGEYEAEIVEVRNSEAQSGAPMTTVVFRTKGQAKMTIYENFVDGNAVSAKRTLSLLRALNMMGQESVDVDELTGKAVRVRVEVEDYDGIPQPRIRRFMPPENTPAEPKPSDQPEDRESETGTCRSIQPSQ